MCKFVSLYNNLCTAICYLAAVRFTVALEVYNFLYQNTMHNHLILMTVVWFVYLVMVPDNRLKFCPYLQ